MGPRMLTPVNGTDDRGREGRRGARRAAEAQSMVTDIGGCYATARRGWATWPRGEGQPPPSMGGRARDALAGEAASELRLAGVGEGARGTASWGQGTAHAETCGQERAWWEPWKVKQDRGAGAVQRGPWSPERIGHPSSLGSASSVMPRSRWVVSDSRSRSLGLREAE